jgi:branched-chain amino acid transport system substrate-binding protein
LRVRSVAASSCLTVALAFGVAACGSSNKSSSSSGSGSTGSTTLSIYSSLPLQGDSRPQSEAVVNGEKLALQEHGGKVGKYTIKYVSLDDSTAAAGKWDPGATSSDARKAAQDKSTIAYLGEFNSGASAISIPILNEAGILQVSPSNTAVGLTQNAPGADKGEPDKYYPSGKRTYGRVVPTDTIQAAAQVSYQKDQGCKKLYILNDKEVYGKGLADVVQKDATPAGIQVLGNDGIDTKAANFRSLATKIKSKGADCMFFGGITDNKAVQVWTDVGAANPNIKMFGPDGVAESSFTTKVPANLQSRTFVTNPTLDPKLYPPAAQDFFKTYKQKFGKNPEPYAIYGYEAMQVALLAIQNAGDKGNDRQAVIDQFFKIKDRDSVLGKYSIDQNGDTTLSDYGGDKVKGGQLVFDKVIKAKTQG